MSLSDVRPYFRTQLDSLAFTEWEDAFQDDNIPSTLMDRAYFQSLVGVTGTETGATHLEMTATVEVRCYFKGYREPAVALDEAIDRSEEVIKACCNTLNQAGTGIKGVYLVSLGLEPLNLDTNDNVVRAVMVFDCRVEVCLS
jgi:hypothetical protein